MSALFWGLYTSSSTLRMSSVQLEKPEWEKDHAYLIQYPRSGTIPNLSPWSLKLETWLRMANIPYTNISNDFQKFSKKGQVPFVEYNGRHIPDSNFIIKELTKELNKVKSSNKGEWAHLEELEPTSSIDRAIAHGLHALIEDRLVWCLMYFRVKNMQLFTSDSGWGRQISGIKKLFFNTFWAYTAHRNGMARLQAQGIGRHSPEEVEDIAKEIFHTLSVQLGDKDYFFGDSPTTFDCCAFAFIAQFIFAEVPGPTFKKYLEEATPNLSEFVRRMKTKYWPDWKQIGDSREMNTKYCS